MKKKTVVSMSLASVLAAGTLLTAPFASAQPLQAGKEAAANASQAPVFSATQLDPDLAANLQAQGIKVNEPGPKHVVNGNRFAQPNSPQPLPRESLNSVQKNLALLVKFPAENGHSAVPGSPDERIPASMFNDLLYGTSYNPYALPQFAQYATAPNGTPAPTDRTLHNYYNEVSYGKVNVTTDDSPEKVGWVTAPHPYSYYFGNTGSLPTSPNDYNANGFGDYPHNVQGLVEDVVKAADPTIDFSKYADANGEIPGIFIIHEGTGGEWSSDPQQFWSHKWELNEPLVVDGVKVSKYSMEPEYGGNLAGYDPATNTYVPTVKTGPFPPAVGVYAHEFGHILGLPDLYDYGYESEGVGAWTVMAGGSWARYPNYLQYNGNTPVHLDAWDKYFAGLVEPQEVSMAQITNATLPSSEDNANGIYKVTVPGTGGSEYFLFENRQLKGYDLGLARYGGVTAGHFNDKMHGLLAYHVDDNVFYRNFWRPNEAEDFNPVRNSKGTGAWNGEWHYAVGLIQADGHFDLEKGYNSGDAGDAYPGATGKNNLTFSKDFYSGSYYAGAGSAPFFGVNNITEQNGVVSAQFTPVK